jgi:hypothetical protein
LRDVWLSLNNGPTTDIAPSSRLAKTGNRHLSRPSYSVAAKSFCASKAASFEKLPKPAAPQRAVADDISAPTGVKISGMGSLFANVRKCLVGFDR